MYKLKIMQCCCCGNECLGRQWWNRDTGYSLCSDCVKTHQKDYDDVEMKLNYGVDGYHYNIKSTETDDK